VLQTLTVLKVVIAMVALVKLILVQRYSVAVLMIAVKAVDVLMENVRLALQEVV
jgi:hypothetical protein